MIGFTSISVSPLSPRWCFPPTGITYIVGENTNNGGAKRTSPLLCVITNRVSPTGIRFPVGENTTNGGDASPCWCFPPTGITFIVGENTNNGTKIIYRFNTKKDVILHLNLAPVGGKHQQAFRYLLVETPTRANKFQTS